MPSDATTPKPTSSLAALALGLALTKGGQDQDDPTLTIAGQDLTEAALADGTPAPMTPDDWAELPPGRKPTAP